MIADSYALELRSICKSYSDFSLQEVSFSLPKGSIMGFIGENGAGKTTTIKAILNLIRLDAGEIFIMGHNSVKEERSAKMELGVVFEELYLQPQFRSVDLGAICRGVYPRWDQALYEQYLTRFALPAKKPIKEYSRGMRMKLSLAAAFSHHPKLLLLDEATSGLDPVMRNEILDLLLEFIQDEEHAVLLSSHITGDLEKIADYITYLRSGRVVFSEQKDDLLQSYGVLRCRREEFTRLNHSELSGWRQSGFGAEALVADRKGFLRRHPELQVERATLEEIMVLYDSSGETGEMAKEELL